MGLAPGTVFAGFTIEATLGVGGMGTVYRARHPRLPRSDALKLLRPELSYDPDFAVRFAREADLAARLNHPNIVGVNDRGEVDGQLWISMPYIEGTDAEQALGQGLGPMPAGRAVRIIVQIAGALDFAHRNGLWHRDVKPANILLAPGQDGEPERALLTDFGIAKAADEGRGLTKTGNVIATFDYAPPEQIEGRGLDHRVDVYALGCVLYKLLTGSVPYPGVAMAAALHGHLNLPPPRPTGRTPWLAPDLDQVIARAMAKDPDARYPTCRTLATAAQAALNSLPELPPPPYTLTATRTDPHTGHPLILGPLHTHDLTPTQTTALTNLIRTSRFFDLPPTLPPKPADPHEPPATATGAGVITTIALRSVSRSAAVRYDPALTPRPPEFDEIVRGLEEHRSWRPAGADVPLPPDQGPASATVIHPRPTAPPYAAYPEWPAAGPSATFPPPTVGPRTFPPPTVVRPTVGPPTDGPMAPGPARATGPQRRGRRLVALLVAAVLLIAAGLSAFVLTRDGATPTAGDPGATMSTGGGSDSGGVQRPPTSAELGLPSGPPLVGTVLVANQEVDGNLDLYAVESATGGTVVRLTSDAAPDFGPIIAPDRASVVFIRRGADADRLWVVASNGAESRPLFAATPAGCDNVRRPAWNPADPSILAVVCVDGAGTTTLQLLTVSGDLVRTLDPGSPQFDDVAFSPDGGSLVYWGNDDPSAGDGPLYLLAADGSTPAVPLTDPSTRTADPIWSPDGSRIALRAWIDDGSAPANTEIFVIDPGSGSDPPPLAADVAIDQDPAWSPDGSMIVFKSDRADGDGVRTDRLWIMNADGSDIRLLTTGSVVDGFAPAWANR